MAGGLSRACDSLRGRQGAPEAGGRPVPPGWARSQGQVPLRSPSRSALLASVYCQVTQPSWQTRIMKALLPKNWPAGEPFGKKTLCFKK